MIATEIIAHRGLSSLFPENTLIAIRAASKVGATWVELDTQVLSDDTPVIFHDLNIERTSSSTGVLTDLTEERAKALEVGSWLDPKFEHETIPLLQEALDLIDELNMGLNLEIKYHEKSHNELGDKEIAHIVQHVYQCLRINPPPPRGLLVSSSYDRFLQEIKKLDEKISVGLISYEYSDKVLETAKNLGAKSLHLNKNALLDIDAKDATKHIADIKEAGLELYVFTVNDKADGTSLLEMGCSGIFTDYPQYFPHYLP